LDGSNIALQGYVDADMAGDRDNRRSIAWYVFTIGGTAVIWVSKLRNIVALSTMEAEYVASTKARQEMIWLKRFMDELGKKQEVGRLYNDNQSARVPFILQRTQHFIPRLNIYNSSTISYGQCWKMDS